MADVARSLDVQRSALAIAMSTGGTNSGGASLLICRVGAKLCGLPLRSVIETMRPLAVEPLANMPRFVRGLSLVRGRPTPVIDARLVLGESESDGDAAAARWVRLEIGERHVALLVDAVSGIRSVDAAELQQLPPIVRASQPELEALGVLDSELLLVLHHARLMSEQQLASLASESA